MAKRCNTCGAQQTLTEGRFALKLIWKLFFIGIVVLVGFIAGAGWAASRFYHPCSSTTPNSATSALTPSVIQTRPEPWSGSIVFW